MCVCVCLRAEGSECNGMAALLHRRGEKNGADGSDDSLVS